MSGFLYKGDAVSLSLFLNPCVILFFRRIRRIFKFFFKEMEIFDSLRRVC